jgi:hypothetical protein
MIRKSARYLQIVMLTPLLHASDNHNLHGGYLLVTRFILILSKFITIEISIIGTRN